MKVHIIGITCLTLGLAAGTVQNVDANQKRMIVNGAPSQPPTPPAATAKPQPPTPTPTPAPTTNPPVMNGTRQQQNTLRNNHMCHFDACAYNPSAPNAQRLSNPNTIPQPHAEPKSHLEWYLANPQSTGAPQAKVPNNTSQRVRNEIMGNNRLSREMAQAAATKAQRDRATKLFFERVNREKRDHQLAQHFLEKRLRNNRMLIAKRQVERRQAIQRMLKRSQQKAQPKTPPNFRPNQNKPTNPNVPLNWQVGDCTGNCITYQRVGASGKADMIRVSLPNKQYPNGSWERFDGMERRINANGEFVNQKEEYHIPLVDGYWEAQYQHYNIDPSG